MNRGRWAVVVTATVTMLAGISPGDAQSTVEQAGGHTFAADLAAANGHCRYRWQGPAVPGAGVHEELTVKRTALTGSGHEVSCVAVGVLAGEVITNLGRHWLLERVDRPRDHQQ